MVTPNTSPEYQYQREWDAGCSCSKNLFLLSNFSSPPSRWHAAPKGEKLFYNSAHTKTGRSAYFQLGVETFEMNCCYFFLFIISRGTIIQASRQNEAINFPEGESRLNLNPVSFLPNWKLLRMAEEAENFFPAHSCTRGKRESQFCVSSSPRDKVIIMTEAPRGNFNPLLSQFPLGQQQHGL